MQLNGVIANDEIISNFFKHTCEICFESCHRYLNNSTQLNVARQRCFYTLDAYSKLIW